MSSSSYMRAVNIALVVAVVVLAVTAALLGLGATSQVQYAQQQGTERDVIVVRGIGTVSVRPDETIVSISVEVRGSTAVEASEEASEAMANVVDAIKSLGIDERSIKTTGFSVTPEYSYQRDKPPTLIGYRAVNTVKVKLSGDKLEILPTLIDEVVKAGANLVYGVSFTVSEEKRASLRAEAIRLAIEDAKAKANEALAPLGLSVKGVAKMEVNEQGFPSPIVFAEAMAQKAGQTPPIFPGESEYRVSVIATFVIG